MLPDLNEIKIRRKMFSLTQNDLAEMSSVSQSLIAKIESQQTIPSYANAKKLFDTLERLEQENIVNAGDIMTEKAIYVKRDDRVKKAISLMSKGSISQLPVFDNKRCVGAVSEKGLLEKFASIENVSEALVEDVMGEALPTVSSSTPITLLNHMLNYSSAVLVTKNGKTCGIISKSDLLQAVVKKR